LVVQERVRDLPPLESSLIERPKVVAAVPAFNEERTVGSVVLGARQYADEVVVVDDGSTDRTAEIAALAGARVLRHPKNQGYGAAIATCFQYARDSSVDALVVLDGDGQHDPAQIPIVLAPVLNGEADISIGSRFLENGATRQMPGYRKLGISILTRLTNVGVPKRERVKDGQSGFRAYSTDAVQRLRPVETDMGASAEILLEASRQSLRTKEVPIDCKYDVEGSSKGPVRHALTVLSSVVRYLETEHALLTFGLPGVLAFLVGLVSAIGIALDYGATGDLRVGLTLVSALLLVGGMVSGSTGLILHAVINAARRWRVIIGPPE
jgi:hypothetical protein